MKAFLRLFAMLCSAVLSGCSTLPEPEKEPFSQILEKGIDAPSGDGMVDRAIENAATTFPKNKPGSSGSTGSIPPPPR